MKNKINKSKKRRDRRERPKLYLLSPGEVVKSLADDWQRKFKGNKK